MRNFLAVFIAIVASFSGINSQAWTVLDIADGIKPSIEVNSSGTALIAYMDEEAVDGFVRLASITDDVVSDQLVEEGSFYGPLDIELDQGGSPRIVYHDHDLNDAVMASLDGTIWNVEQIPSPGHDGWDCTIYISGNDNHVVSVDPSGGIEYAFQGDSSWMVEVVDGTLPMYRFATDIEVDGSGVVHVVYFLLSERKLYYAQKDTGTWTIEEIDTVGLFPSLVVDASGTAYVGYYQPAFDGDNFDDFGTVRLATNNSGTWVSTLVDSIDQLETTTNANSLTGARTVVSLRMDASEHLHIAYSGKKIVRYGRRIGGIWDLETVVDESGFPTELGQLTSLALGNDNISHISYYEKVGPGNIKYAYKQQSIILPELTLTCPPDTILDCNGDISPLFSGLAIVSPDTAMLTFTDSVLQTCPFEEIIQRTWVAAIDTLVSDTCVQLISLRNNGLELTSLQTSSIILDSICLTDVNNFLNDSLTLGCNVVLDTVFMAMDSLTCSQAIYSRTFQLTDQCLDSTFVLVQNIQVDNYPLIVIDNIQISDSDSTNGSISFDATCDTASVSYAWSTGDTTQNITSLDSGLHVLTVTNLMGCSEVFEFVVGYSGPIFSFICPPDTTIGCSVLIDPEFTGAPVSQGYTDIDFVDNILQNCPEDVIIERSWFGTADSINYDTCVQVITVVVDSADLFSVADTLHLNSICLDEIDELIQLNLNLPCNLGIDSIQVQVDSASCELFNITANYVFSDQCRDTSFSMVQLITITNPVVLNLDDQAIQADTGGSTGSIQFITSCVLSPVTYLWSDGSTDSTRTDLRGGSYTLTVTNSTGCEDIFKFSIPFTPDARIVCPPDTTLQCASGLDPEITGFASVTSSGSGMVAEFVEFSFNDEVVQDCPEDQIIERTWVASLDSIAFDTCVQQITVEHDNIEDIQISDTLFFTGICLDSIDFLPLDSIVLGCNHVIDSTSIQIDSSDCNDAWLTRVTRVRDECRDTTLEITQSIHLTDIPVVVFGEISIIRDNGDSTGAVVLEVSCPIDSFTYQWSNGSSADSLSGVEAGLYSLTLTNSMGCIDSFNFTIPEADSSFLICPPDTTITCLMLEDPEITGSAEFGGYSEVTFEDETIQDCPDDRIIRRTWIALADSIGVDSCIQLITVTHSEVGQVVANPDTLVFEGICMEDLSTSLPDSLELGCDQVVDTSFVQLDTMGCGFAQLIQNWIVSDLCIDSTFTVTRTILMNDIPVVVLDDVQIIGDPGDSSGSIMFTALCAIDSLSYAWSDGSTNAGLEMAIAGDYMLTVTNLAGCLDSFSFQVPVLDTTVLVCPPDTTIDCLVDTDPSNTGMGEIMGFNQLIFQDSVLQDCPDDQLIQRMWIASLDSTDIDTCVQLITVVHNGADFLQAADTVFLSGICLEDYSLALGDSLTLGCNQVLDTIFSDLDTLGCGFAEFTQTTQISDLCLDTVVTLVQKIVLSDIPVAKIVDQTIMGDPGDSTGSIFVSFACIQDTLNYSWSNGSSGSSISMLGSGSYGLTLTDGLGCTDSFVFEVPFIDTTMLFCPPDTIILCSDPTDPDFTGTAEITGFSSLTFIDSILQACPDNQVIERTWIASLDTIDTDTCVQLITITNSGLNALTVQDTLQLSGVCLLTLEESLTDSIALGCQQVLDTSMVQVDSISCGFAELTRTWIVTDQCLDTTITLSQTILVDDLPLLVFDSLNIQGDVGDSSGSITFNPSCLMDSLSYVWSNGQTSPNIDMLSAGDYSLTVTSNMGCVDSFDFNVPFIDTTRYLFTVNLNDRSNNPIEANSVRFLDLAQNELDAQLMNSAVGNYDYGILGDIDDLTYVCPDRDVEPAIAGLTVLDLIRSQRFVLGLSEGCPEDEIAGDVNFSGDISGSDLVLMRRVMLDIDQTFPDSVTWQFIHADTTQMPVVTVPGCILITDENREMQSAILKGVKLGDFQCPD